MEHSDEDIRLALSTARKAMKIVVFIGMVSVILLMINIYIMLTQISATAQITRELQIIKQSTKIDTKNIQTLSR